MQYNTWEWTSWENMDCPEWDKLPDVIREMICSLYRDPAEWLKDTYAQGHPEFNSRVEISPLAGPAIITIPGRWVPLSIDYGFLLPFLGNISFPILVKVKELKREACNG